MKKTFLSILFVLALCLCLSPMALALPSTAGENVSYINKSGQETTQDGCTPVTSSTTPTPWGASGETRWYVVNGDYRVGQDVTITGTVTVTGEVNLILRDNAKLTLNGGLQVNSGAKLHIYGQSAGTGELNVSGSIAVGSSGVAAIYMDESTLEVNGGKVNATGGEEGYSYGIFCTQNACNITVTGGTLKATGGAAANESYGIWLSSGGNFTVSGGELTAEGGTATSTANSGYSIGICSTSSGSHSITVKDCGILTAAGNTVSNASSAFSVGIDLQYYAITVENGGKLTATGGDSSGTYSAESYGIFCKTLTVKDEGTTVTAKCGTAAAYGTEPESYDIRATAASTVSGGTVQSDATGAPVLMCANSANSSVTVSGGTIKLAENSVMNTVTVDNTVKLSDLPAAGYGFKSTGETVTWYDDSSKATSVSNVTVKKLPIKSVSISTNGSKTSFTYGEEVTLTAGVTQPEGKNETVTYQWYKLEGNNAAEIANATSTSYSPTNLNGGSHTYRVTATVDGYSKSGEITITVKAALTEGQYTAPTANTEPDYNGTTAHALVTAGSLNNTVTAADVKFMYRLGENGTWTESVPTATKPGTYKVYWYINGGAGYNDIGSQTSPNVLTVTWTARVGTAEALRTAVTKGWSTIQLTGNIDLTDWDSGFRDRHCGLFIGTGKDITLDLNGHLLRLTAEGDSNYSSHVILVMGGQLTVIDSQSDAKHTDTTLRGGAILCTAETSPSDGIVAVYPEGTAKGSFTMRGGTLTGSVGYYGGVYVQGSNFTMSGGTITGCTGNSGGGVYLTEGSTFTMSGGTIIGCTANQGGGVLLTGGSTFTMSGGTVTGCTAANKGGGVYAEGGDSKDSTFTMTGGTITNCTANLGGGVYTGSRSSSRGILRMSGGTVTGCKVVSDAETGDNGCGSGVYLNGDFSKMWTSMYANGGTVADDVYVNTCRIGRDTTGYTTFSGKVEFSANAGIEDGAGLTVTFDPADGAPAPAAQTVLKGQKATAPADPARSGYTFGGWYQGDTKWSFDTAITDHLTLTAKWTASSSGGSSSSGSSSSSGGSSSSGSGSSSGSAETPAAPTEPVTPPTTTVTVPVSSDKGSVEVKAEVTETDSGTATATVEISDKEIEQVAVSGSGTVTVDVSKLEKVESVSVPAHVVETTNKAEDTGLTVALPSGTVALDSTALESVSKGEDVNVSVKQVPATDLNEAQQKAVGDMANIGLVVDVDLTVGKEKQSSFNGGKLTISVPYTPKRHEDTSKLTVWFIHDDGTIENKGGYYDAAKGCFVFETEHLSRYVLVYDNKAPSFPDVPTTAYFYDAVNWAVAQKITNGVDGGLFAPDLGCTRAQIVTFLYRCAMVQGVDVSIGEETNILSYADALEVPEFAFEAFQWAVGAGIIQGSDGKLMPNDDCTRAQIVTMLYRYAAANGMSAVTLQELVGGFADASEVPGYALPAFNWALARGIIQGADGKLMPNDTCTRGQIVTMLYRANG